MFSLRTLPDRPTVLLRLALMDLGSCERDPRYAVSMDYFHGPATELSDDLTMQTRRVCVVSLAGAVLAKSLGADPERTIFLHEIPEPLDRKLSALCYFSQGRVRCALSELERKMHPAMAENWSVWEYRHDPGLFKQAMIRLANRLEELGA